MRTRLDVSRRAAAAACLLLLCAAGGARAQWITVGENRQVSADEPDEAHTETLVAADPEDTARLIAVAMIISGKTAKINAAAYTSGDGGRTWRRTLLPGEPGSFSADPACAFGPGGAAYFAYVTLPVGAASEHYLYRSPDGGRTWIGPARVKTTGSVDRPFLAADATAGPGRGRLYDVLQMSGRTLDGKTDPFSMALFRSRDGGATFEPPARLAAARDTIAQHPGNAVVLSDGTVLCVLTEFPAAEGAPREITYTRGRTNAVVESLASRDGGGTLEPAVRIAEAAVKFPSSSTSSIPSLAADPGSKYFKDRVYAAFTDAQGGRTVIRLSYSADEGRTWSVPQTVNDDAPFADDPDAPDDFLPAVAVNRDGVVGVTWYDRRESPDNLGWAVRFSASLDGGETFTPSVRVSTGEMDQARDRWALIGGTALEYRGSGRPLRLYLTSPGFRFSGGHSAGMAAAADGTFHPVWIDNRTGVRQVWTAAISVKGEVLPNGDTRLAGYEDVSDRLRVEITDTRYDAATGEGEAVARLRNTSGREIVGPVVLRAVGLQTRTAREVRVTNADNHHEGTGAVWHFGDALPGNRLAAGGLSGPKRLAFRLSGPLPFRDGSQFREFLLYLDVRALAPRSTEAQKSR